MILLEYFALGFFQGALLKHPKKLLVQLGQTQAGSGDEVTSAKEIITEAATMAWFFLRRHARRPKWLL